MQNDQTGVLLQVGKDLAMSSYYFTNDHTQVTDMSSYPGPTFPPKTHQKWHPP